MSEARIAPSILAADFLRLGEQIQAAERGGANRIHMDVMDGSFVPNISIGLPVLAAVRRATSLPIETHLMILQPERYLEAFAQAGADTIIIHQEAVTHLDRSIQHLHQLGKRAGVTINPATPVSVLDEIIELVDLVLIMTVNPGFGGQVFIEYTLRKIQQLRAALDARNPACDLEVDGGIEVPTIRAAYTAGARVFVAGTAVFKHPAGPEQGVKSLLAALE